MRKLSFYILVSFITTLGFPSISLADANNDPLAIYKGMIKKSLQQPTVSNAQKPTSSKGPSMNNGQAALIPVKPTAPTTQAMPAQNTMATQQYPDYSTSNSTNTMTNSQQQAPAGPPNIFVSPGGSSTNNDQSRPVIHY